MPWSGIDTDLADSKGEHSEEEFVMNTIKRIVAVACFILSAPVATGALAETPEKVRIAGIFPVAVESAWAATVLQAIERLRASPPHGLEIEFNYTENVYGDKALTVFETYADAGYDILFGHSSFPDQVEALKDRYPGTMFVMVGSGNRPMGGNAYLMYMHLHEPAYLAGIIGGMMTKSDVLGAVGLFPADDVNDQINAYKAGALSVNPDVKVKVTFIETWYDPAKAAEAANAQVAAGADFIFQIGESFEACKENNVYCFGNYIDGYEIAGSVVPVSTLVYWDPVLEYLIDAFHEHKTSGKPYDAPREEVWFPMSKGGGDISPYHDFEAVMPEEVKAKVAEVRDAIMSGRFTVELDTSLPKSD